MKKLLLVICLLIALGINPCYAANEWRNNDTDFQDGDTTYINDIDTDLSDHVVEPLGRLLKSSVRGAEIIYATAATLTVGDGSVVCSNAAGTLLQMRANTSATTVTWANIDTGAEANDTYYVYATCDADATTFGVSISLNATTPDSGSVTNYVRLGSFVNASGDITFASITNDANYYAKNLGTWTSKTIGTTYQALTDLFVVAYMTVAVPGGAVGGLDGYTDSAAAPSTQVGDCYLTQNYEGCTISFPVKRGDYYKVTKSSGAGNTTGMKVIPLD